MTSPHVTTTATAFHAIKSFLNANNSSACQVVPRILRNPNVHYRVHNSAPPVSTPHHINPDHVTPPYCISIIPVSVISSHLIFGLPSVRFPSGFTTKNLWRALFCPIRATCLAHLIFIDLIARIMSGERYKSWRSLLRQFIPPPVTSSLWGQTIPLSTLFSNTLAPCSSLNVTDQGLYPYKTTRSYSNTCYCNSHPYTHRGAAMLRS